MNTPASVRLTLHLGPVHAARLQRLADEAGVKRSDLIRRWIDAEADRRREPRAAWTDGTVPRGEWTA